MIYENTIQKLKDEIQKYKTENMKLKADIVTLKDDIRNLENNKTFLESYNSRLLYTIKRSNSFRTSAVGGVFDKSDDNNNRKWRISS
tara:strand:- start:435 stop:695 length:261 start_codon:yes stop_codon:yes gene_type:complete